MAQLVAHHTGSVGVRVRVPLAPLIKPEAVRPRFLLGGLPGRFDDSLTTTTDHHILVWCAWGVDLANDYAPLPPGQLWIGQRSTDGVTPCHIV